LVNIAVLFLWIFEIVEAGFRYPCWNGCQRGSETPTTRQKWCAIGNQE
jgi:hypothetical protein